MTGQGIELQFPIGPCRLSLLKGNCQISEPKWRQEGSFLLFSLFLAQSCSGDYSLPLTCGREGEHYPWFSFSSLRRLSEAGFAFIQCRPFGSVLSCLVHPLIPDSPRILCFVNGCLRWTINTGRLGTGFSITKVVSLHCNPPPTFLPRTFLLGERKYSIYIAFINIKALFSLLFCSSLLLRHMDH